MTRMKERMRLKDSTGWVGHGIPPYPRHFVILQHINLMWHPTSDCHIPQDTYVKGCCYISWFKSQQTKDLEIWCFPLVNLRQLRHVETKVKMSLRRRMSWKCWRRNFEVFLCAWPNWKRGWCFRSGKPRRAVRWRPGYWRTRRREYRSPAVIPVIPQFYDFISQRKGQHEFMMPNSCKSLHAL